MTFETMNTGGTYRVNDVLGGVEITFPSQPHLGVRDALNAYGFRYSKRQGFWYAKRTQATLRFAQVVCGDVRILKGGQQ